MLKNNRFIYFIFLIGIVLLGILSRSSTVIPLFFGDVFYAIMVYFGLRFLFIKLKQSQALLLALLFCFAIECSQLYQAHWIVSIRKTTLGHYALGQGFLWSDLLYYTLGVILAYFMDVFIINKIRPSSI